MTFKEEVRNQMIHIGWVPPKNGKEIYCLYRLYLGINTKYTFNEICDDIGITSSKMNAFKKKISKGFSISERMESENYMNNNKTFMECILDFYKIKEVNYTI